MQLGTSCRVGQPLASDNHMHTAVARATNQPMLKDTAMKLLIQWLWMLLEEI
jgi:hypothetical protein